MPTLISGSTGVNKITDGTIVDADINASAAIAGSKLVMPTGSVLQVVQATSNSETIIGTSFTACAPTVTITPSSSSNKILVRFNAGGIISGTVNGVRLQIKRDSTAIRYSVRYGYHTTGSYTPCPIIYEILDSPSTTSATTYTLEAQKQTGGVFEVNSAGGSGGSMTAIAMEIKG